MYRIKQLYRDCPFTLPELPSISEHPFELKPLQFQDESRWMNLAEWMSPIRKVFDVSRNPSIKPYIGGYNNNFDTIMGKENMYPMFMESANQFLIVCSKECFLIMDYQTIKPHLLSKQITVPKDSYPENTSDVANQKIMMKSSPEESTNYLEFVKCEKFNLKEMPSCMKCSKFAIYFGFPSGNISIFSLKKKTYQHLSDICQYSINSIDILTLPKDQLEGKQKIVVLDRVGNVKLVEIAYKYFMEKVVKVSTSITDLSIVSKKKKREKIKKMFKNLISSDKSNSTTAEDLDSMNENNLENSIYPRMTLNFKTQKQSQIVVLFLAVYRKMGLTVFLLEESLKVIKQFTFDSSEFPNEEVSMLEFGEGGFQNANTKYQLLVLSFSKIIFYYRVLEIGSESLEKQSYDIMKISERKDGEEEKMMNSGLFISNNLNIFLKEDGIYAANINQKAQKICKIDLGKFSYIQFFNQEEQLNFDSNALYSKIIKTIEFPAEVKQIAADSMFCCLEGKRLINFIIFSWKTFLQRFIALKQYELALNYSLHIFKGQYQLLCEVSENNNHRHAEMQLFLQQTSLKYLSELSVLDSNNLVKLNDALKIIIYYLSHAEEYAFLFSTIYNLVSKIEGGQDMFVSILTAFIQFESKQEKQQSLIEIPFLSDEVFQIVVAYYKKANRKNMIQKLISNFDLQKMDKLLLLTVCLKEELYESLIYICLEQKDYITPIVKLWGIKFSNDELISSKQVSTEKKILLEQNNLKIKCVVYWYLKQCLEGKNTEYGNYEQYIFMLEVLINFIFIPNSLEMLVQISPSHFIALMTMFFEKDIYRHVLQSEGKLFTRKSQYISLDLFIAPKTSQYCIYEQMLSTLMYGIVKKGLLQPSINVFSIYQRTVYKLLAYLMLKNQFPFKSEFKVKVIQYYIANPFIFSNQRSNKFQEQDLQKQESTQQKYKMEDNYLSEVEEIEINGHLMRLMDSLVRSINEQKMQQIQKNKKENEKNLLIHDVNYLIDSEVSTQLGHNRKKNTEILDFEMEEVTKMIEENPVKLEILRSIESSVKKSGHWRIFSQLKCYLYHELENYSLVIQQFLKKSSSKIYCKKMFAYLQKNVQGCKELCEEFLKNLISFIRLEQNQTLEIITQLDSQNVKYQEVIRDLHQYPNLQLRIIQQLLASERQINYKLLLTHLEIVLKFKPQELEEYIQKIEYPLEEAYKLCEESNNKTGKAYILIKSGRNIEGVIILTDLFIESFELLCRLIIKKTEIQEDRKAKMINQFNIVLQTCYKEFLLDNQRGEDIWCKNLEIVFKKLKINQNIERASVPPAVLQLYHEIVQTFFEKMFEQVSIDFFIQKFVKRFANLSYTIFMKAYNILINRLSFQYQLLRLNKDLLQMSQLKTYSQILANLRRGYVCSMICSECKNVIGKHEKIVAFLCNHLYHEECYLEQNNKKNSHVLCFQCFNFIDNIMIIRQVKHIHQLQNFVIKVSEGNVLHQEHQIKINRFKKYQKLKDGYEKHCQEVIDSWSYK